MDLAPNNRSVYSVFEGQVAAHPERLALSCGATRLTYRELDERARRVASRLRRAGVGRDELVGFQLDRSWESVVAMLGILQAGGAYLPLDPKYPRERTAFMLSDARARVLIARGAAAEWRTPELEVVDFDAALAFEPAARAACPAAGTDLAYAMYTSGSTGVSRCVGVCQRSVIGLVRETNWIRIEPGDRVAQIATHLFDAATFEVWGALLNGGTVVVIQREVAIEPDQLAAALREHEIASMFLTTALFQQIAQARPDAFAGVRDVVFGGEAADPRIVAAVLRGPAPPQRLVNGYGPTETTTFAACHEVRALGPDDPSVPIGRAITGASVYVLDCAGQPAAPGAIGEIFIGGAGVARGYLNRPALTAERFVPDPCSAAPGATMYRTGDLGRINQHGQLEFGGRIDDQVKIRGFRIEPAEVDEVLRKHPGVGEVITVARRDEPGGARLLAYFVPAGPAVPTARELREYLRQRLPEYMLPSAFAQLERLPLTSNGKVDRRALPSPAPGRGQCGAAFVAPRNPVEARVAAECAKLFNLESVGVRDNLFDLGAHSLLLVQLLFRVRDLFGVELPIKAVFDDPTVAGIAAAASTPRSIPPPAIERAPGPHRLSAEQEAIWFLESLKTGSAYNFEMTMRLRGVLDVAVLERALTAIVARHEILRTTFETHEGQPRQRVHAPWSAAVSVVDLTHLPTEEREAAAERLVAEEVRRPFDIARLPLVRWMVVRLAPREHLLIYVDHHLIHDGWSIAVFVKELTAHHDALESGAAPALPDLPVQYGDFARWEQAHLAAAEPAHLAYWRARLAGNPPLLELPTDRPRPSARSFRGADVRRPLPPALYDSLRELARQSGTTLFITMASAFLALLHRLTGRDDLCVGTAVANRRRREFEGLIGMFVNTVVLRADAGGDPTFCELVGRVRERAIEMYVHEELPFARLVKALAPQRDIRYNPIFQASFSFHDSPVPDVRFGGVEGALVERSNGGAKFDLDLIVVPRAEQRAGLARRDDADRAITLKWNYSTDLFDADTIVRFHDYYQRVLEAVVRDPDVRLSALALVDDAERAQLRAWGTGPRVERPAELLHELVEQQIARTPRATAVRCHTGAELTYAELGQRSDQLASALRAAGVGPDSLVGVFLDRSVPLVGSLLATLKAGGAYVALDPALPPARLAGMIADARLALVVTNRALRGRLPADVPNVWCIDAIGPDAGSNPAPAPRLAPDHAAYAIFTSGSTGRPKAAVLSHRAICNHMLWMRDAFPLGADDRVLQKTPPGFDAAVWEFWAPLISGARLVLARPDGHRDPVYLTRAIATEGITVLQMVPSGLRLLLETDASAADLATLRTIFSGGEALGRDLAERLAGRTSARIVNLYGPTEACIDATCWVASGALPAGATVPIGRPIDNMQAYVLDARLQPVPRGVAGELFLAGAGLARGYLGRPALTAERFVPDPFASEPGARMYRTGDLVRFERDGALVFVGRTDAQVKLRGLRIELEEIEAALRSHPAVREAAVALHAPAAGDEQLVAHVVAADGQLPASGALREHLRAYLPEAMIPAAFVPVDALPRSSSGKVDRGALALAALPAAGGEHAAPTNETERVLVEIFQELLRRRGIGALDDFFALGGHSLLAVRLAGEIERRFGQRVPVSALFDRHCTVRRLAERVSVRSATAAEPSGERSATATEPSTLVQIRAGRGEPVFVAHPIGGEVFCYAQLASVLGGERPVIGLRAPGLAGDAPLRSIEALADRHLEAVRAHQASGPYHLVGWSFGGLVAYEIAQRFARAGQTVALLALLDSRTYDPARDARDVSGANLQQRFEEHVDGRARTGAGPAIESLPDLDRRLAVYAAHWEAFCDYVPSPIDVDMDLVVATGQGNAHSADTWSKLARRAVRVHPVAASHYDLLTEHVRAVGAVLEARQGPNVRPDSPRSASDAETRWSG